MKKVLITGGAGFIGSNLAESLVNKGYEVIVYDNLSSGYLQNLDSFMDKIVFVEGDICDYDKINSYFKGVDAVFHLAAVVDIQESVKDPIKCFDINVRATINIINQCIKNSSKFVFASSAAIYGEDKTPIKTEYLNPSPISPYAISKLDVEILCEIYKKASGLKYACFRNFNVYGPRQVFGSAYAAVIPSFVERILSNKNLKIYGTGEQTRDFIYVDDVVRAYILALEEDCNGIFNLGCNEIKDIIGLANLILKKMDSNLKIDYMQARKGDIVHSRASSDKFKSVSSWTSCVDLNEGLDKTLNYYKKMKDFSE